MQELIDTIRGGDTTRLGELFDRNQGMIYKLAQRYLGIDNAVTLDDLVQCGFLGLCSAVDAWDPERGAWSTITYQYVRKAMRAAVGLHGTRTRAHNMAVSLDEPLPGDEDSSRLDTLADESLPDADAGILEDERAEAVRAAVDRLEADRAEAVRLHDLQNMTYEQAGRCMSITIQQAHNLRACALRDLARDWRLKKALDEETRFHAHKGVTAFLSDWTSSVEEAAMWRIEFWKRREQEWIDHYELTSAEGPN
jgi:RNA polymerase sigma factor (sigma-70 family)